MDGEKKPPKEKSESEEQETLETDPPPSEPTESDEHSDSDSGLRPRQYAAQLGIPVGSEHSDMISLPTIGKKEDSKSPAAEKRKSGEQKAPDTVLPPSEPPAETDDRSESDSGLKPRQYAEQLGLPVGSEHSDMISLPTIGKKEDSSDSQGQPDPDRVSIQSHTTADSIPTDDVTAPGLSRQGSVAGSVLSSGSSETTPDPTSGQGGVVGSLLSSGSSETTPDPTSGQGGVVGSLLSHGSSMTTPDPTSGQGGVAGSLLSRGSSMTTPDPTSGQGVVAGSLLSRGSSLTTSDPITNRPTISDLSFIATPSTGTLPGDPPTYSGSQRTLSDPPSYRTESTTDPLAPPRPAFRSFPLPPPSYTLDGPDDSITRLRDSPSEENLMDYLRRYGDRDVEANEYVEERRPPGQPSPLAELCLDFRNSFHRKRIRYGERVNRVIRDHKAAVICLLLATAIVLIFGILANILRNTAIDKIHEGEDKDGDDDQGNSTTTSKP